MVRIKRVSKDDPLYNLGYRWQIIDKYGTDIAHTLPKAFEENGGFKFEHLFAAAGWQVETGHDGWLFKVVTKK